MYPGRRHGVADAEKRVVGTRGVKEERRKTRRVPAEHLVSYVHYDDEGQSDEKGMARTLDLSEGGMVLEMRHSMDVGSGLDIKMVSGDRILGAKGRVVHSQQIGSKGWRVGVCFTEVADGDLAAIAREVHGVRGEEGKTGG